MKKNIIKIDSERCKGCGLCISVCPAEILTYDNKNINSRGYFPTKCIDLEKCIGCRNCETMCPDLAIRLEKY